MSAPPRYHPLQKPEEVVIKEQNQKHDTRAYISILLLAAVPCLLIVTASTLLIGLTLCNRVTLNHAFAELQVPSTPGSKSSMNISEFVRTGGSDAYYTDFNPSTLSTIASMTGKFIPYLSSAIMGMVAVFAADFIFKTSQKEQINKLLTLNEMTLLLGVLAGGLEGLWKAACYRSKKGSKFKAPNSYTVAALAFVTLLGFIIPAIDTWFGIVVMPSEQTQLKMINQPTNSFGRGLLESVCFDSGFRYPCGGRLPGGTDEDTSSYPTGSEAFKTLNNISRANIVTQFLTSSSQILLFLLDAASSPNLDFKASTFAISTQCQLMNSQCFERSEKRDLTCSPDLSAQIGDINDLDIKFFNDSGLTQNTFYPSYPFQNPLYFSISVWMDQPHTTEAAADPGDMDNESAMEFNCSATIFKAIYTWVHGSVAEFNITLANGSLGAIMSAPFIDLDHAHPSQRAVASSIARLSNSSADIVAATATAFSYTALAISTTSMERRTNLLEQSRSTLLLTRVPIIPFYILITLNALYVLCTMLLAVAAIIWTHLAESAEVKSQLTVEGLMAAVFKENKSKANLQSSASLDGSADPDEAVEEEVAKIAILKTEQGGWSFATVTLNEGKSTMTFI